MSEKNGAVTLLPALNPYTAGAPVEPGGPFFGREALLKYIPERIRPRSCRLIVLQGPRRMGKTSFLRHLAVQLPAPFLPVYFDLSQRATEPLPLLVRDLAADVMTAAGMAAPARRRLEDVGQAHRMLSQAFKDVAPDRRLVILFDEFDPFEVSLSADSAGHTLFPYLQELIDLADEPSFVVALGRMPGEGAVSTLPMFGTAPRKRLGVLSETDARRLLMEPPGGHCVYTELAARTILELAGGHPYFLQMLASELFHQPRGQGVEPIGLLEVMALVPQVLQVYHPGFEWIWKGLTSQEQKLLFSLASSGSFERNLSVEQLHATLIGQKEDPAVSVVASALSGLEESEFIKRTSSGSFSFRSELMRRWVVFAQPLEPVLPQPPDVSRSAAASQAGLAPLGSDVRKEKGTPADRPRALLVRDPVEEFWNAAAAKEAATNGDLRERGGQNVEDVTDPVEPLMIRAVARPQRPVSAFVGRSRKPAGDDPLFSEFERLLQLGLNTYLQGDYKISIASYRHALAIEPGHVEASLGLCRAFIEHRQFDSALECLLPLMDSEPDTTRATMAEVYLRWLDEVETDEDTWTRLLDKALTALPHHHELLQRKKGAQILRVKRLLKDRRYLEAAAAAGTVKRDQEVALAEVRTSLLDTLETLARRGHADAAPLFVLLRRLIPEPRLAWLRYLGPMLDEAELTERFNPQRAEDFFRKAENTLASAGTLETDSVPGSIRERIEAGIGRCENRHLQSCEAKLTVLIGSGDLERAEAYLEAQLVRRRSPRLEARLREIRKERQLLERFNAAVHCLDIASYSDAQQQFARVVSESPEFVGPDGRTALELLEEATLARRKAPLPGKNRESLWWVPGVAVVGAVALLMSLVWWGGPAWRRVTQAEKHVAWILPRAQPEAAQAVVPMNGVVDSESAPPPEGGLVERAADREEERPPASHVQDENPGVKEIPGKQDPEPGSDVTESKTSVAAPVPSPAMLLAERSTGSERHEKDVAPENHTSRFAGQAPTVPVVVKEPTYVPPALSESSGPASQVVPGLSGGNDTRALSKEADAILHALDFGPSRRSIRRTVPLPSATLVSDAPGREEPASPKKPEQRKPSSPGTSTEIGAKPLPASSAAAESADSYEALIQGRQLNKRDRVGAQIHAGQGEMNYRKGDIEGALQEYEKAIALDPLLPDVHFLLGQLYVKQGQIRKARSSFRAVVQQDPTGALGKQAREQLVGLQGE